MKMKMKLVLILAVGLAGFGASAQDCDYIAALEGYSLGEFEGAGFDQAAIDAAPVYLLEDGGTVDIDLPAFGDVVKLVDGTACGTPSEFWTLWDHEDPSTYTWPDGPNDPQQGGGDGTGDDPYGLYMVFGEPIILFRVEAGAPTPPPSTHTEASIGSSLTFFEEDANVNLTAVGTAGETPAYTWTFDGGALPANATADGATLSIEGLDDPSNIGTYACTWDGGEEGVGASAEGDCDYEALLDAALAGEWDWMLGDFSTGDFDAALAAASTTILPIGGSTTLSVEGFDDFVHIIGACVEIPDDDSAFVAWDHGDGADWTYPADVLTGDGEGGSDLIGDTGRGHSLSGESPYGLFVGFGPGTDLNLYIVSSGGASAGGGGTQEASLKITALLAAGSVPATNYLGLIVLSILMAFAGMHMLRRRQLS